MYNDENMRILYGVLEPGASIGIHEHTDNSEEVFLCFRPGYSLY